MVNLRTPREINLMRKAGLVVWNAHQLVQQHVQPGVTTAEIDAVIERYLVLQGCSSPLAQKPSRWGQP